MFFGYKIVKNKPEHIKITGIIKPKTNPSKVKHNLFIDEDWITAFRSKAIHYRYDNPEGYLKRVEGQRVAC